MQRSFSAFTRSDILLVTIMIAIFASIVLVCRWNSIVGVQRVYCRSNLKQLGVAVTLFTENNALCLPMAMQQNDKIGTVYYCDLLNIPYVVAGPPTLRTLNDQIAFSVEVRGRGNLHGIFYCPEESDHGTPSYGVNSFSDVNQIDAQGRHGTHRYGLTKTSVNGVDTPVNLREVSNPGATIYLVDSKPGADFWHVGQNAQTAGHASDPTLNPGFDTLAVRHHSHFFALFVDGHSDDISEDSAPDWWVTKPQ